MSFDKEAYLANWKKQDEETSKLYTKKRKEMEEKKKELKKQEEENLKLIMGDKIHHLKKKEEKPKKKREIRRGFDFKKDFKGLFKEEDLTLEESAPKGIKGLGKEGLGYFLHLFRKMRIECIPTKRGDEGMGERISVYAKLSEMKHFIENFAPKIRECSWVKYDTKHYPYTGKEYVQFVWTFRSMKKFQTFVNSFVCFKPSTEIIWVHDYQQRGTFFRFENPSQSTEMDFLTKHDEQSTEKMDQFCKEKLPSQIPFLRRLAIVVGEVPLQRKRVSVAKLIYTLNEEPHLQGGTLKIQLSYEVEDAGTLIGCRVQGEEKTGDNNKKQSKKKQKN